MGWGRKLLARNEEECIRERRKQPRYAEAVPRRQPMHLGRHRSRQEHEEHAHASDDIER